MGVIQNKMMEFANLYLLKINKPMIVDVGAYTGNVVKKVCDGLNNYTAYCIEACPKNFKVLKKNTEQFKGIIPINIAISSYNGIVNLYVANHDKMKGSSQSNSLHKKYLKNKTWAKIEKKEIPCLTLDDFCENKNIKRIHYLIINCEGCEFDIFKSKTKRFLEISDVLYIELHGKCKKFNSRQFIQKKKEIMNKISENFVFKFGNDNINEQKHMEQLWIKKDLKIE